VTEGEARMSQAHPSIDPPQHPEDSKSPTEFIPRNSFFLALRLRVSLFLRRLRAR
jgi:hypothetical protein